MTQYMILIYDREADYETMTPEGWASLRDAHTAFQKTVTDLGGSIQGGDPLDPTTSATSIRGGTVTDGPFVEAKEFLGGYYLVDVADRGRAIELAGQIPDASIEGLRVEVRQIMFEAGQEM
jgi:hypothetical protein